MFLLHQTLSKACTRRRGICLTPLPRARMRLKPMFFLPAKIKEILQHRKRKVKKLLKINLRAVFRQHWKQPSRIPIPSQRRRRSRQATTRRAMSRLTALTLPLRTREDQFAAGRMQTEKNGSRPCTTPTATFEAQRALTATTLTCSSPKTPRRVMCLSLTK